MQTNSPQRKGTSKEIKVSSFLQKTGREAQEGQARQVTECVRAETRLGVREPVKQSTLVAAKVLIWV